MPEFTSEQLIAIDQRDGELLLDAGAGSGKTSVLVERFVRAVLEDGVDVTAILAITFTDKAAAELRDRIRARFRELGALEQARATEGAFISTIHGFCAGLLRAHALAAGIDPRFVVLDELEAGRLADLAFDGALAEADSELIASYGAGALRWGIFATYAKLRSRGESHPALPPLPPAPPEGRAELQRVAAVLASDLGALPEPSTRVCSALDRLARVAELGPDPWPGDIDRLRLPQGNGAALQTPAGEAYSEALGRFRVACEHRRAERIHPQLDRLLRTFGARYADRKRARSGLDFEDLELMTRDLLSRDEQLRARYAERFAHVMVDEFQDTNAVQLELISAIARDNLFAVGDAQQSIYGFRHADVELFERLGERLAGRRRRATLDTNFRSRREILEVGNRGFGGRQLRVGRDTPPATDPLVELLVVEKQDSGWRPAEAQALAERVRELIDGGAAPRDVVVLTRAATDLRLYESALEQRGIPTYLIGGRGYWSHPQVVDLLSYLRALANPRDQEALYVVLASPLVGLSFDALVLFAAAMRAGDELPDGLAPEEGDRLEAFRHWFEAERRLAGRAAIEELIERALERTGYDLAMLAMPGGERRLANVRKLMRLAREHEQRFGRNLRGFLELARARAASRADARESEAPVDAEALDAVRLMTIHRAKGLEFEIVCVADLGREPRPGGELLRIGRDGQLGLRLARPGTGKPVAALSYDALGEQQRQSEEAEERRIFYVAMTRARERLILSGATPSEGPIGWLIGALGVEPTIVPAAEPPATTPYEHVRTCSCGDGALGEEPAEEERPTVRTLSYSALSEYDRCAYRFYLERVLGLPPVSAQAGEAPEVSAAERGVLVHRLLEELDFRRPRRPQVPEDVADLIEGFIESSLFERLAAARDLRREQGFAFLLDDTLITGVLDVVATEPKGATLIVDYKSDRLAGAEPADVVERAYGVQRLVYALAALRSGAQMVHVVHLFLERCDAPVEAVFTDADASRLARELTALAEGAVTGKFPVAREPCRQLCSGCPGEGGLCSWPLEMTRRDLEGPDREPEPQARLF